MAVYFSILLGLTLLSEILQPLVPSVAALGGARFLFFPALLAYGSLALPYPLVLALAFCAGLTWDLLTLQVFTSSVTLLKAPVVEIGLGLRVLLLGVFCTLMHGMRPLFLRGHWELHIFLSGLCTVTLLLTEYLLVSLKRGGLDFSAPVWWRIFAPGVASMIFAPFVYLVFTIAAHWLGLRENTRESRASPLRPLSGL